MLKSIVIFKCNEADALCAGTHSNMSRQGSPLVPQGNADFVPIESFHVYV